MTKLLAELTVALAADGAAGAVEVCHLKALPLTAARMTELMQELYRRRVTEQHGRFAEFFELLRGNEIRAGYSQADEKTPTTCFVTPACLTAAFTSRCTAER